MEKSRTFSEDIKINRFDLDQGSEEQPSFYDYWSGQLTDARFEKDQALDHLNYLKADKELHYRNHPKDDMKVTESSVKAMVETDEGVVKAKAELNEIYKTVNQLTGQVTALEHRKSELKNLTNLWIAGYFAGTRHSSVDDKTDEARKQLNKNREKQNEEYNAELLKNKNKESDNE